MIRILWVSCRLRCQAETDHGVQETWYVPHILQEAEGITYYSSSISLQDMKRRENIPPNVFQAMVLITNLPRYRRTSSAHSLGFTLGLLALHIDCQERVLQEVQSFVAKGNLPVCRHSRR